MPCGSRKASLRNSDGVSYLAGFGEQEDPRQGCLQTRKIGVVGVTEHLRFFYPVLSALDGIEGKGRCGVPRNKCSVSTSATPVRRAGYHLGIFLAGDRVWVVHLYRKSLFLHADKVHPLIATRTSHLPVMRKRSGLSLLECPAIAFAAILPRSRNSV